MAPQKAPAKRPTPDSTGGFIDVLGILLVALPLTVLLLAIGAQLAGQQVMNTLPDWVMKASGEVWTWATGAGGVLTILLRAGNKNVWRTYLRWILGITFSFIACTLAIAVVLVKLSPKPSPAQPQVTSQGTIPLRLRVTLKQDGTPPASNAPSDIRFGFDEKLPTNLTGSGSGFQVDRKTGAIWPNNVLADFPLPGGTLAASVYRTTIDSVGGSIGDVQNVPWSMCLTRKTADPAGHPEHFARLDCTEGIGCKATENEDPGWFDVKLQCPEFINPKPLLTAPQSTGWIPTVHAAGPSPPNENAKAWGIPSLATLKKLAPTRRTGYTEFNINSKSLNGIAQADTVYYSIRVNGEVALIDGLPEWSTGLPFKPANGLAFDFGLQNLNFTGDGDGCERIGVSFSFRKDDRELRRIDLSRLYSALRNPTNVERTLPDGSIIDWGGAYRPSNGEGQFDVLQGSKEVLANAQKLKQDIDAQKVNGKPVMFNGLQVVGVLRAPLRTPPVYGIMLGLLQPNGQLRFTFDSDTAYALRAFIVSLHMKQGPFAALPLVEDPSTRASAGNVKGACESMAIGK
jgi:hypothetical protein